MVHHGLAAVDAFFMEQGRQRERERARERSKKTMEKMGFMTQAEI